MGRHPLLNLLPLGRRKFGGEVLSSYLLDTTLAPRTSRPRPAPLRRSRRRRWGWCPAQGRLKSLFPPRPSPSELSWRRRYTDQRSRSRPATSGSVTARSTAAWSCCMWARSEVPVSATMPKARRSGTLPAGWWRPAGGRSPPRSLRAARAGWRSAGEIPGRRCRVRGIPHGPPGPTRSGRSSGSAPTPARPWPIRIASPADHGRCCSLPGAAPAVPGAAAPSRSTPRGRPRSSRAPTPARAARTNRHGRPRGA